MKKRVATLCCLMVLIQSSVVIADEPTNTGPQASAIVTHRGSEIGPLRRASLQRAAWTRQAHTRWDSRQDPAPAPAPDTRSWVERHPVWTGAMVGFAAGSAITYAATSGESKGELFDFSGLRGAAVILFGGISAGVGALAGWGIGRSQDDGYHDRARTVRLSNGR